jgi:glycyl-tRNA synthetase beta chain
MPDLLIELLSEEIPARMQPKARADLQRLMTDGLVEAGLTYAGARAFSTPRRLALTVQGLSERSPTTREERRGPREGAPEKAVQGFARGAGVPVDALELREEKKGRHYYATVVSEGREADAVVAEVLERVIRGFPWPKSMRWGEGSLRWVRPLRRILCILTDDAGTRIVPLTVDGVVAADVTDGLRIAGPAELRVASFEDYARILARAKVMIDHEARAEAIATDARNLAFAQGCELIEDPGLLEEVTGLVEWPVVLMGEVGDFQDLPPEVLQTSMKEHQKFFSVRDRTGAITRFVTVANGETPDDGATILAGNRKVLTARLSDARFFWENDLKVAKAGMGEWLEKLRSVTFHEKLGTQAERIERIGILSKEIASKIDAEPSTALEAAALAKVDLVSEMVYEFPELQGIIGEYYLRASGKPSPVARVAPEHYAPLGPSDGIPRSSVALAVALADKLDQLTTFWAISEKPTGSRDPFALRRAALGIVRIILERELHLSLAVFLLSSYFQFLRPEVFYGVGSRPRAAWFYEKAFRIEPIWPAGAHRYHQYKGIIRKDDFSQYEGLPIFRFRPSVSTDQAYEELANNDVGIKLISWRELRVDLLSFIHDRLKVYLRDRGIRHDVIDASLAMPDSDDLTLLVRRATALQALIDTEDGTNLVQGFKRANNILTQAEERDGVEYSFGADRRHAQAPEEHALFDALDAAEAEIAPAMEEERFEDAMRAMARLRGPVDAFFEAVQVNAENQAVRRNRLNLLSRIRTVCSQVADLTRLEG